MRIDQLKIYVERAQTRVDNLRSELAVEKRELKRRQALLKAAEDATVPRP